MEKERTIEKLLRIFVGEMDRVDGQPLHTAILEAAMQA